MVNWRIVIRVSISIIWIAIAIAIAKVRVKILNQRKNNITQKIDNRKYLRIFVQYSLVCKSASPVFALTTAGFEDSALSTGMQVATEINKTITTFENVQNYCKFFLKEFQIDDLIFFNTNLPQLSLSNIYCLERQTQPSTFVGGSVNTILSTKLQNAVLYILLQSTLVIKCTIFGVKQESSKSWRNHT